MAGYIDADTHVVECEQTWEYLDPGHREFKPIAIETDLRGGAKFWLIGDNRLRRGLGSERMPEAIREMRDVPGRLRAMDALGVDYQILHPTALLMWNVERPDVELAITRSYNRWMADVWSQAPGRFRWSAVPPLRSMHLVAEELEFAARNGACGVLLRGTEANRSLSDPYFDPLYAAAQDLDLALCIHVGSDHPARDASTFMSRMPPPGYAIYTILPNIAAFFSLLVSDVPQRFPRLRVSFLESGASWIPFALREAERAKPVAHDALAANRLFVACQTNDDLPYLLETAGPGNLIIGTDYGHADLGSDIEAHRLITERTDIPSDAARRIVDDNARLLFGLPAAN